MLKEELMSNHATQPFARTGDPWSSGETGLSGPAAGSCPQRELDRMLDQALEDSFPASDPVSIVITTGHR
jgi:hypothetical protein